MRSDARRNRELIVTTASTLLTRRGSAASMEEIARAAGLGVGTLYRHFPDRQALLVDVAAEALRTLLAPEQAPAEDGWATLLRLVALCTDLPLAVIKDLTAGLPPPAHLQELVTDFNALLAHVIARTQREGTLRSDIPPAEVIGILNVALCRPGARADDHLTTVLLDGLRARAADDVLRSASG
ncbi:TetR family transcriptional regulator [Parafrankia colletiae]|uniref:TetR family transcriptional regulator n=1 Tax=Parafrankia colletiae TaxID=573497 RepID=A0A1S1Q4V7_9ACTN|nr:TetR/AcrR family transcriptional regulator [Parafrankia colletiae]MCK9904230.1 TetR/AcrR family transcriptional regulator [Frankia sp. Cpl3]OHV28597.1 TetR family transcriptional regulator [Parafrankia colletiae]